MQQTGQIAHRAVDKFFDLPGQRGIEVHDQHLDQRGADILGAGPQLLPGQVQRRPQAHARRAHRRHRDHAGQVDAQADPVQKIDFFIVDGFLD